MTFHLVAEKPTETNVALVSAVTALGVDATFVRPQGARRRVRAGDLVLGRVDVLPSLDGVESCLWELRKLERHGTRVLNGVGALLASHDKLVTALRLGRAALPHPRTVHVDGAASPHIEPPLVVKPRFGSWGRDVIRCDNAAQVEDALRTLRRRRWFRRHGALAQELIPNEGRDLRVLVAGGVVVGGVEREAAPGEWRTNVALGGTRWPARPSSQACELAVKAAAAIGADLVAVDLLPTGDGEFVVLEINGAADFNADYSPDGTNVFAAVARALMAERGCEDPLTSGGFHGVETDR